MVLNYILITLIGYVFGMSNMAWYIAKIKHIDLRSGGSGNLGASNATIMMGKGAGILTFLHDVLKVVFAAWICAWLFPNSPYAFVVAGVAGVLGHIFPVYLRFKGGKGFASFIGLAIVLDWRFGLLMLLCVVIASFVFDWVVAGTFLHIVCTPLHFWFSKDWMTACIIGVASICIFLKHVENIKRMRAGQETRLRSVLFKKSKS